MRADIEVTNPYWDLISPYVRDCLERWNLGYRDIGNPMRRNADDTWTSDYSANMLGMRFGFCGTYAWTVTDPETVSFVREHSTGKMVDPMAGTGYWAYLLGQMGVDVICYDKEPGSNHWHKDEKLYVPVLQSNGADAAACHPDRALLLSWPPYNTTDGYDILKAYGGDRVVYIGESEGGCCGSDAMHELFETEWVEVEDHRPVQWWGIHDWVTVYDRRKED